MVETEAKPSSDRSAKECRNVLFRVLSIAHKKIHANGNSNPGQTKLEKRGKHK